MNKDTVVKMYQRAKYALHLSDAIHYVFTQGDVKDGKLILNQRQLKAIYQTNCLLNDTVQYLDNVSYTEMTIARDNLKAKELTKERPEESAEDEQLQAEKQQYENSTHASDQEHVTVSMQRPKAERIKQHEKVAHESKQQIAQKDAPVVSKYDKVMNKLRPMLKKIWTFIKKYINPFKLFETSEPQQNSTKSQS